LFIFSLFFDTNTTKIYINAGVITGSYYNKYIIDNYENDIDTNNTSPSHTSQVQYITRVRYV
jgi:hypothetical protein